MGHPISQGPGSPDVRTEEGKFRRNAGLALLWLYPNEINHKEACGEAESGIERFRSTQVPTVKAWPDGVGWGGVQDCMGCLDDSKVSIGPSGETEVGCELPNPILSVHFLQLHSAVLKPDFNLSIREVDATADF